MIYTRINKWTYFYLYDALSRSWKIFTILTYSMNLAQTAKELRKNIKKEGTNKILSDEKKCKEN